MWVRLTTQYLRNAVENRYVLQTRFFEYRYKPDQDIMTHITEIETMATQLTDIGAPVDAISIMTKIICTLPPSYRSFVTAWDSVPFADRTMALLTSRLLKEEEMAKRWNAGQPDPQDAAFFAHQHPSYAQDFSSSSTSSSRGCDRANRGTRRGGHFNNRQQPYRFCKYFRCNIAGHTIEVCRKRIRDEEDAKKNKNNFSANPAVTPEEKEVGKKLEHTLQEDSSCFIGRCITNWFADSGATQHMTDQRSLFRTFTPISSEKWNVNGIGSARLLVRGYGSIEFFVTTGGIQREITIEKVLFVPGLGTNLVSISAVTDVGLSVHFIETRVTFAKNEVAVMVGERIGKSLYHLAITPKLSGFQPSNDSACFAVPSPTSIVIWHQRLAHVSYKTILRMASNQFVDGLQLLTNASIPEQPCLGCVSGKMCRSPFPTGRSRANEVGQLIHSDVCGPMHVDTPGGAKYFALFTDDYSGWRVIYFLKQKSEVADSFKNYVGVLRSETGHLVHTLRADNGGEFTSSSFKAWLSDKAIKLETSAPHSPEQNGVSERANRTIVEGGRSLLHAKHLPLELWGEATSCAVYALNRVTSSKSLVTPYQSWYGKKPNISHLRIFGSTAFIHVPKAERRKLDSKSLKCYFVGYSLTQKAYRFWDPVGRKIKISRDVIFDETCNTFPVFSSNPELDNPSETLPEPFTSILKPEQQPISAVNVMPQIAEETQVQPEPSHESLNHPDPIESPSSHLEISSTRMADPTLSNSSAPQPDSSIPMDPPPPMRASPYPLRIREPKRQWKSFQSIDTQQAEVSEPSSFSEAMESSDAHLWKAAIQEEYDSLMSNKTWYLTTLPPNRTSIKSRWVFKVKPGVNGSSPRYKARLVAKGFSQRPGIDFEETFSPVVKYDTLRVILSLVAALDLDMSQLDVKTAFLYGEISEEIYLQQPEGYALAGQENHVCRLQKCLYGLKQASRVWNRHFDSFIKKFGLQPSNADPCLYVRRSKNELVFVVIWVDDCLVISNNGDMVTEIIEYLSKIFEMRCTQANHFVGLSITRSRQDKTLYLSQPDYIKKILKRFHMTD